MAILGGAVVIATCISLATGLAIGFRSGENRHAMKYGDPKRDAEKLTEPPSQQYRSGNGKYRFAAVASDVPVCSKIGTEVMARHRGNVVDAAVATVVCGGVVDSHSSGIGGGAFFVFYNRTTGKAVTVNSRETAPLAADTNMFVDNPKESTFGGKAIAVPGELKGLWYMHQNYGSLDWASLLQPAIDLCRDGFELISSVHHAAVYSKDMLVNNPVFSFLFDDQGEVKPVGSIIYRPKLADTLEEIAKHGVDAFYNGPLADKIVAEIQENGGIITREDLEQYQVDVRDPVTFNLTSPDLTVYSMPPPSSGVLLEYILNILSGYGFSPDSISNTEKSVLTYHRIAEAMKFAYAKRTEMGDARFLNISEFVSKLTSPEFGEEIRSQIDDNRTHDTSYYGPTFYDGPGAGTAHFSLMDGEGNAVAVTSTVNTYFGSKVKGSRTGIIYNNEMDDFSTPNTTNFYGVPASEANFIMPGKRPMSSMSPSVFVDRNSGDVKLVAGASGGTRITTATALLAIDALWFNRTLPAGADFPRMHHQLLPPQLQLASGFPEDVLKGLQAKGHDVIENMDISAVDAIERTEDGMLDAVVDYRKGGAPDGF